MSFERFGHLVYRRRRRVLVVWALVFVVGAALSGPAVAGLRAANSIEPGTQAAAALAAERTTGVGADAVTAVIPGDPADPTVARTLSSLTRDLRAMRGVTFVADAAAGPTFIAHDHRSSRADRPGRHPAVGRGHDVGGRRGDDADPSSGRRRGGRRRGRGRADPPGRVAKRARRDRVHAAHADRHGHHLRRAGGRGHAPVRGRRRHHVRAGVAAGGDPTGRGVDLRPEHHHPARARAGDRLRAAGRLPVPGAPRAAGSTRPTPWPAPWPRPDAPSPSRPSPSPSPCAGCCSSPPTTWPRWPWGARWSPCSRPRPR